MKTFSKKPGKSEELKRINCPVCSTEKIQTFWDCGNFQFVRCPKCKHIYQNPQPRPADLLKRYDEEYMDYEVENSQPFFELMLKGLEDMNISDIEELFFSRGIKTPRFLDVGCATGVLVEHFQNKGWESCGLEVCEPAARFGIKNRGVTIHLGTLDSQGFQSEFFHLIHSSHVIEHVNDPRDFLIRQFNLLEPGGYILVTTPNTHSLQAKLRGSHWRSAIADHVHLFTKKNLVRLLRESGFKVEQSKTWGGIPAGQGSKLLKRFADWGAKCCGFGDVMIIRGQKPIV